MFLIGKYPSRSYSIKRVKKMKIKAFTLIEVLFALIILAGFATSFSNIWFGNSKRIKMGRIYDKASHLMEEKIAELELQFSRLIFSAIPEESKGDFENEVGFSWSLKTKPLELPPPEIFLGSQTNDSNELQLKIMSDGIKYFTQSILEAQVTIHFDNEGLKSSWSITTYIADPNAQIEVSL